MPAVSSKDSTILVTGVTGYIGSWVAKKLLERGYRVRGTFRDDLKAKEISETFSQHGDKLELVQLKDMEVESAFDQVVKGVEGIIHVASPCNFDCKNPKEMIDPAVNGTIAVLKAAKKSGDRVKRIVITSFAAVVEPKEGPHEFPEKDWNHLSPRNVAEKGGDAGSLEIYRASKVEAEKAAWKFVEEEKPDFDIATILPTFVFGPVIHPVKDAQSINLSVGLIYSALKGEEINEEMRPNYVDVRDVAEAHILAMEKPEASGNRFIVSSGHFGWGQVNGILRRNFPESKTRKPKNDQDRGDFGQPASNKKAKEILGIQFIQLEETVVETAKYLTKFL
eukprot:TRINITY_DN6043_c0_g1_i1.p1 TRINITY_DN6043_c0_g1~~TRINITY_DN6043_c0_g1_i1.p1  ORF type:complete len:336 (+),score=110.06 TRINITY_DN6043_c0_g1_i1:48-1055(+)